jgi:hypothetical protein
MNCKHCQYVSVVVSRSFCFAQNKFSIVNTLVIVIIIITFVFLLSYWNDHRATPNDELELSSSTDSSITNPASAEPQKKPMRGHKRVSSMPDKSSILGKTKTPTATEGQKKQAPTVIVTKVEAKESNKLDKKSKEKSNKSKKLIGEKVASKKDKTKPGITG